MKSLLDSAAREQILTRFDNFTESSPRQWGKMSNGQMLSHLIDLFEVTFAERPVVERKGIMNSFLGRWLLSSMPLPKNSPTDPEYLKRPVGNFAEDKARVIDYIKRFAGPDKHTFGLVRG
ncbi:MAG: hypothetical protein IPP40_14550 [bacterium]|nr:hypothetical protein [bacterium]